LSSRTSSGVHSRLFVCLTNMLSMMCARDRRRSYHQQSRSAAQVKIQVKAALSDLPDKMQPHVRPPLPPAAFR
jgi:hypothetical protein